MFIYQVTVTIQSSVMEKWTQWMKTEHLPEVMATGMFTSFRFFKVTGEEETVTQKFVVQYEARTEEKYKQYKEMFAKELQKKAMDKFEGFFTAERRVMGEV